MTLRARTSAPPPVWNQRLLLSFKGKQFLSKGPCLGRLPFYRMLASLSETRKSVAIDLPTDEEHGRRGSATSQILRSSGLVQSGPDGTSKWNCENKRLYCCNSLSSVRAILRTNLDGPGTDKFSQHEILDFAGPRHRLETQGYVHSPLLKRYLCNQPQEGGLYPDLLS